HHRALAGQTPHQVHTATLATYLAADFQLPKTKQPLYEGRIHFMRAVQPKGNVLVLNSLWTVPQPQEHPTVWVTLEFQVTGATLSIYDAAPDSVQPTCLASYPFPVSEPILPHPQPKTLPAQATTELARATEAQTLPDSPADLTLVWLPQPVMALAQGFWGRTLIATTQLARHILHTMY
ncbi:MAG: hypothetical protein AB1801_17245, partial [Chloroflexota bacterium]